jgi:hypothetical protein
MDITVLQENELKQITDLQVKKESLVQELGQIELLKLNLKARRVNADKFLATLIEEEETLGRWLEETYGKGTINLEKGEFTPLPEV